MSVSDDEGESWNEPRELPISLTGDRHTGKYGPDGRLSISFRGISPGNKKGHTTTTGVEILPDGTVTYGHWPSGTIKFPKHLFSGLFPKMVDRPHFWN